MLSKATIERLLAQYDRPGPRYTSYPTVPHWPENFGPEAASNALESSKSKRLSLYAHVPFCRERCLYCGCNVVISPKDRLSDRYLAALEREIELVCEHVGTGQELLQLHWGGGTPTYLDPPQMRRLFEAMTAPFQLAPDADVSVEVDPSVTSYAHLEMLRSLGFRRISMGVQDLDPKVQQAIGRIQPEELTGNFNQQCADLGFDSINMDLIYGLPHQSVESFAATVETVIAWQPHRVAMFSYAHIPWMKPHQKQMPAEALPDAPEKLAILMDARQRFEDAGYLAIGIDHFARPGDELYEAAKAGTLRRNFMGYTSRPTTDILAFGMSAISEIGDVYYQNAPKLHHYLQDIEAGKLPVRRGMKLSDEDQLRKEIIAELMCTGRVDYAQAESQHGISFLNRFGEELKQLQPLAADGLVDLKPGSMQLTESGELFARNVAMAFDQYLEDPAGGSKRRYSQTV